jgi:hypothetical protein
VGSRAVLNVRENLPNRIRSQRVFEASICSNLIYILFYSQKGIFGLLQNICILFHHTFLIIRYFHHVSLYNLVNETKFLHEFFLVYLVNFL